MIVYMKTDISVILNCIINEFFISNILSAIGVAACKLQNAFFNRVLLSKLDHNKILKTLILALKIVISAKLKDETVICLTRTVDSYNSEATTCDEDRWDGLFSC